jgi:diguanylate cyclase (GGDEF)-like protein
MIIDGVLGSEAIDSSGEILDVEGADISDVDKGTLLLNWEHEPGEKGANTIVGKVIAAKKIFGPDDCENDRQYAYWQKVKLPFIYGICRLFDGAGHENAKAIAAIIRDNAAHGEMLVCRFSVEGSTLEKEGNRLKASVIRRVAVTVKPCNRTANSGLIEDPNAPEGFETNVAKEKTSDLLSLQDAHKNELAHPLYERLGRSEEITCNPLVDGELAKALTLGGGDVAPSATAGFGALVPQSIGKGTVLATLRDYGSKKKFDKTEFRAFAKMRLPEASDEFLDHFSDMAEDYHVRRAQLVKKEEAAPAAKQPKVKVAKPAAPAAAKPAKAAKPKEQPVDEEDAAPIKIANGTIRGIPTQPLKMRGYKFDEQNGILHTPKGSFPLYNPDKGFATVEHAGAKTPFYKDGKLHVAPGTDMSTVPANTPNPGFREIYNSQPIEDFHSGKVMPNWIRLHELTKSGQLPDEVVMHSAMFSMMSPNTPVRPHELMYSHLADTFEDLGIDPRDPDFKRARKHWLDKDQGTNYPRLAGDYFRNHADAHLSNDSEAKGRKAGELMSFMLGQNKFDNVQQYHKLHSTLVDMVKRHGVNSRAATAELMGHKHKQQLFKQKYGAAKSEARKAGFAAGLRDHKIDYVTAQEAAYGKKIDERQIAGLRKQWRAEADKLGLKNDLSEHAENAAKAKMGEYKGVTVPGLAPKTGRFTFTMLGGGNTFVPDTHIIRHLFGMDADKDGDTLAYLKSVLWNANNHHVLEGIDRWYAKNHPAAQTMQQHPTWGRHFQQDPEQANFPAFWRHWCSIAEDERRRGMVNKSANEFSTHEPFFLKMNSILDRLKKSAVTGIDHGLLARLLVLHSQYHEQFGEIPAQMMYVHHIVPHLLEMAQYRQRHDDLPDFAKHLRVNALEIELRKAASDLQAASLADPQIPTIHGVHLKINGQEHRAGRFAIADGHIHHLEDYYGLLNEVLPEGKLTPAKVATIHGMKMSPSLRVDVEHVGLPKYDEVPQEIPAAQPLKRPMPSVFHYRRAGMDQDHVLEVRQGHYLLDGNRLSYPEVQSVVSNLRDGSAQIRYPNKEGAIEQIRKMESQLQDLMKAASEEEGPEIDEDAMLQHARAAEAAGHLPKGFARNYARSLYEDPMTPGMGNKKAWQNFAEKKKPGTYIQMDGNSFKAINDAFGHQGGDSAIKAFGAAARSAMDEAVGQTHGKLFRNGGDEFIAHVPSPEHAAKFSRLLSQKLQAMPAIEGKHQLSMAFGFGHTPEHADKALYAAKAQKIDPATGKSRWPIGQVPNLAHSLVPGHEGPLPLHDPQAAAVHGLQDTPQPAAAAQPNL